MCVCVCVKSIKIEVEVCPKMLVWQGALCQNALHTSVSYSPMRTQPTHAMQCIFQKLNFYSNCDEGEVIFYVVTWDKFTIYKKIFFIFGFKLILLHFKKTIKLIWKVCSLVDVYKILRRSFIKPHSKQNLGHMIICLLVKRLGIKFLRT